LFLNARRCDRRVAALLVGAFLATMCFWIGSAQAAPGAHHVKVFGSVSGKTLTVDLRARPFAKCNVWLGQGEGKARLPRTGIGPQGRGQIEWDIPSDTSTGDQPLTASCGYSGQRATGTGSVDIPESAVSSALTTVLNIALDAILAGTLLLFLVVLVGMVVTERDRDERFMRSLALVAGALVALGAQAAGISYASYAVDALAGTGPGGGAVKFLSIVIPGGVAAAFGWFFMRAMRDSTAMGLRWMSFLGMLTVVTFGVIFAQATETQGVFLGAAAIPNTSFVVGLIFSVLAFRRPADAPDGIGFADSILGLFSRVRQPRASGGSSAPEARNPFADD
jgi:hypothetical protein